MRVAASVTLSVLAVVASVDAQTPHPGRVPFERICARCHGADGRGGEMGPGIVSRLAQRTEAELSMLVRDGLPTRGMPGHPLPDTEMQALVAFARTLRPNRAEAPVRTTVALADGSSLGGIALNRTATDLQLLADGGGLHLLRRAGEAWRRVTSQTDWPTYHGDRSGNRFSPIDQINRATVSRLAPAWVYPVPGGSNLQVTPVVVDGVMYVTNANECSALDAGSGRRIWHYQRPRTKGLAGDAASGINRGVAIDGDRLFMVTDHAHLIALNRLTGDLLWETPMADWRQNYGATSAPLVVGHLVISGISGGDEGVRGFLAAYDRASGKEAWRFWTVPAPGEPKSETWGRGASLAHGCAATWLTGTYDPDLQTLYWPTGNPCPDYDGGERQGDNLYADSILALDPATGRLKWHFQYTPHDLWDWDAQQPPVLVDTTWNGQPRKLLLHANRNGFFYVLDRTTGALLLAKPFVKKLTWAREIGVDGRPVLNADQTPTAAGRTVCPAVEGATNWFSTAFSPATNLYYVQALEKCTVYARTPETWRAGQSFYGGTTRQDGQTGQKVLRAIDVGTGAIAWEMPQIGRGSSWGGTMATAGGLVFVGEDSGALMAVDAANGTPLWQFQANVQWKASPMTYVFDGRQYIAVAAGPNILAFALVD
ncbi:MAG: PQQ-binding-like beta-propeller repeat protein [Vicinamibacteraceae bacterium]